VTMRALRAHHRGGPEQLVLEDAPTPAPAGDEALVEVHAAAITLAELTYGALRPGGRLITLSAPPDQAEAGRHHVRAVFFVVHPDHDQLTRIAAAVDDGSLRPIVSEVFPLEEGRAAFEHGAGPRRPGKIVLNVRP
jgi:NADPH:quinone reductase-like Zn-dependent oxidoreductase